MSTIIRGSVRKPLFSLFIWRGGFVLLVYALQLMTMRFAALERKRAAGFARISIESVGGFKFNALLWHFGFASLKDKGLSICLDISREASLQLIINQPIIMIYPFFYGALPSVPG